MHNVTFVPSPDEVFFYPMGNTPAVNLLSHHSPNPGKDGATEILSLACGDPRSILYSLWCEGKPGGSSVIEFGIILADTVYEGEERFNFTCCDLEPAVLARNVLLFSLMLDNTESYRSSTSQDDMMASIWNICYHFFIGQEDLMRIREQSARLLDYSETPEKWASSPYSVVKFVSLQTVDELRQIWTNYNERRTEQSQKRYDSYRRAEIRKEYERTYGKGGKSLTSYTGPHWQEGLETMNKGSRGYWTKGVVGGNAADVEALGNKGKGYLNPLIMISSVSEKFRVHFSSDPLTGFHLTSVFDGKENQDRDIEAMVTLAKTQFREWSKAFIDYALSRSVQVNFYYGDAINFCHELAARNSNGPYAAGITRLYTTQWSSKPLLLDGEGAKALPLSFDVIDTSNLADWVGLINVLLPMVHILARRSTSVLWTETFRLTAEEPDDDLYESLFMDVDLASLMIGLAPVGHLLGYGIDNSIGEDIIHLNSPNRYRMRVPWKIVLDHETKFAILRNPQDQQIHFDAEELAEIFFDVYLMMFVQEDLAKTKPKPGRKPRKSQVFNRYCRLSFATFIQHALGRIRTNQEKFFTVLLLKIRSDETLHIGENCVQDLVLQLSLSGTLVSPIAAQSTLLNLPRFKSVTLVVPREDLQLFQELGGAPGIHLAISRKKTTCLFFSIDCFFGSVKQNADGSWGKIVDDPTGWAGSSDLIITTPVPPELVAAGKWDCFLLITLSIHAMQYMQELGPDLTVFHASSKNKRLIFTSDRPPRTHSTRQPSDLNNPIIAPKPESEQAVVISATQSKGSLNLQAKYSVAKDSEEAIALGAAAFVTLTDVSPCSILLRIGDKHSHRLIFPYPIDAAKVKTRIARKSLWIEVNVPVASALVPGGYDSQPFPVVLEAGAQPSGWSLPRVDLQKQPIISTLNWKSWVSQSFNQYTSKRECAIIEHGSKSPDFCTVLPLYKRKLHDILIHIAEEPEKRLFLLAGMGDCEAVIDILIIVDEIRHARESGGMIVDAWVYLITQEGMGDFMNLMPKSKGQATVFRLKNEETLIWKHLLPAAVESCRRDWRHKESCEYLVTGQVPLTFEAWGRPICNCGNGMDVEGFPESSFAKPLKNWVTRIGLPTLSAVPYVEATGNFERL